MKLCYPADNVINKNKGNVDITKWRSKTDIIHYLKPLKQPGDGAIPTNRESIVNLSNLWKHRERKSISNDIEVLKQFDKWKTEEEAKHRGKPRNTK